MSRDALPSANSEYRGRWWAMLSLCCGVLMISVDATVVNVAIPSIARDLHFPDIALPWIVNAYLGTFGGFLLLAGRLGDIFGHRRIFVLGIGIFTVASLGCGVASSPAWLIIARSAQGFGGAIVSAAAVSLIMTLFSDGPRRAHALGIFSLVGVAGGSVGVFLGGALTGLWNWHWAFFINIPVGVCVSTLCFVLMPKDRTPEGAAKLDVAGAVCITSALILANYALLSGGRGGWLNADSLLLLIASGLLLLLFVGIENCVSHPILPLALLGFRNLPAVNIAGALLSSASLSWTFVSSLYLQRILHFTPLQTGAAFLPINLLDAVVSIAIVPRLIARFGTKSLTIVGMLLMGMGLALFARAPVDGTFLKDVLPGMVFLGLGVGVTYSPLYLSAMSGVSEQNSGAISGLVNASWTMGGTVGLAVLVSTAVARTDASTSSSSGELLISQNAEYQMCFYLGAVAIAAATLVSGLFIHAGPQQLQRFHPGQGKV